MKTYVVTGVSGCGRIEVLRALSIELVARGFRVDIHDVGERFVGLARSTLDQSIVPERILDIDPKYQKLLCTFAMREVMNDVGRSAADYCFVGVHATFRWRGKLMEGVSYRDIRDLAPDGFINVVDHVERIVQTNSADSQWGDLAPGVADTQDWMMEEEFVTEVLADVFDVRTWLVGRDHRIANLADLFCSNKPRAYLSYPITAIRNDDPELLEQIQTELLPVLEKNLVVFDPLVIRDMELKNRGRIELHGVARELSEAEKEAIEQRTCERDFQLIDQSQMVVVAYLTDKDSPGVHAELEHAGKLGRPVYGVFLQAGSPFLARGTTKLFDSLDSLIAFIDSPEFGEQHSAH